MIKCDVWNFNNIFYLFIFLLYLKNKIKMQRNLCKTIHRWQKSAHFDLHLHFLHLKKEVLQYK